MVASGRVWWLFVAVSSKGSSGVEFVCISSWVSLVFPLKIILCYFLKWVTSREMLVSKQKLQGNWSNSCFKKANKHILALGSGNHLPMASGLPAVEHADHQCGHGHCSGEPKSGFCTFHRVFVQWCVKHVSSFISVLPSLGSAKALETRRESSTPMGRTQTFKAAQIPTAGICCL